LQDRMRRFGELKGVPPANAEDAALDAIQDSKLADFDDKSATMLLRIDSLGRVPDSGTLDCSKLDDIKTLNRDLLGVMKAKSDYMLVALDAKIAEASGPVTGPKESTAPAKPAAPPAKPSADKPAPGKSETAKSDVSKTSPPAPWPTTTTAATNDAYSPPAAAPPPVVALPSEDGYSVDEIKDATRGFFGAVSTNLASVIEHAFKTTGRPTAYVLGTEGGGAFFAGLRFGEGTLFMRNAAATRPVYWHGPSLGTDFGASGSRTMFLIYRLNQPEALFRSFTGVDGSAYFVGGVGVTLLKGGEVIMAPIRSGLGLRLGANIGYLRFSDRKTWNPF
jgi:hypothetical protein